MARDAAAGRVTRWTKAPSPKAQRDAARLALPAAVWNYVVLGCDASKRQTRNKAAA